MGIEDTVSYKTAEALNYLKEREIEKAIDHYFSDTNWSEGVLSESGVIEVHQDGTEVFILGGTPLLRFGQTTTKIDIESNSVICKVSQEITRLYGDSDER